MTTAARQTPYSAVERIKFSDLVSGVPFPLFTKLPNGVIPISLSSITLVPFNSATTDTLTIGRAAGGNAAAPIAANATAYKSGTDLKAAAGTKVESTVLPAVVNDASGGLSLTATWTGVGTAPTAGELLVILNCLETNRELFTQG
jgi:hypothetical protein